ncbi:MAG: hypothetical protein AB2556_25230, partial [Candidatus Thiodiazotropha sp.]
ADHRAKEPALKALKREIRLQPDRVQCRAMRQALPACLGWDRFMEAWKPADWTLSSRQKVRDRAQMRLFERHEKHFSDLPIPLLYRPKDTRRQNIMITIPGPLVLDGRPDQQELVPNDVVEVSMQTAREVVDVLWGQDWALGYAITVHSSQGLTIADPKKSGLSMTSCSGPISHIWLCQGWSTCTSFETVVCPPEEGSEGVTNTLTEQQLRNAITKKLVAHKQQDQAKGLRFNLKVDQILELKEAQDNHCAACNIELLWAYQPKDTQQFSIDRLDNSMGHIRDNIRLTCLECNQKRGAAALSA